MGNKIAVITSLCGINTKLVPPSVVFEGVSYIAFVDKFHESNVWEQRKSLDFTLDDKYNGRRNAKIYKVLPQMFLPEYDYWFWVDSTHELIMNPNDVIQKYLEDYEIGVWNHTDRSCLYKEAEAVNDNNYDYKDLVNNQIEYYKSQGYPENNGLYELPVIIRKNTDNIKILNMRWWEQICRFSSRDQISMPFVLWKTGITPKILPGWANGGLNQNPIMPQFRHKGQ
jgi:hypothetical protein